MNSGVIKGVELDFRSQCALFLRSRLKVSALRSGGGSSPLIPKSKESFASTDKDMARPMKLLGQCVDISYIFELNGKAGATATRA